MIHERYKVFRPTVEPSLHLIVAGGLPEFDKLPERIRRLGPWQGAQEGDLAKVRPHYRAMLAEQGFVVVHARLDLLRVEVEPGS